MKLNIAFCTKYIIDMVQYRLDFFFETAMLTKIVKSYKLLLGQD